MPRFLEREYVTRTRERSPIPVLTGPDVEPLHWSRPTSYHYSKRRHCSSVRCWKICFLPSANALRWCFQSRVSVCNAFRSLNLESFWVKGTVNLQNNQIKWACQGYRVKVKITETEKP